MKFIPSAVLLALFSVAAFSQAPTPPTPPDSTAPMTDADRAKRDANKVFQFIKLHAVRANPAPTAAAAPTPKPVAAAKPAVAAGSKLAAAAASPASATNSVKPAVATEPANPAGKTGVEPLAGAAPELSAAAAAAAVANAVPTPVAPTSEPAAAETEEIELAIIKHVQPELPNNRFGGLRSGSVWVQFTVEPDGSTKAVVARPGAQIRLAQSAVRAVEQWRFAPIPSARDVAIEFAFKIE